MLQCFDRHSKKTWNLLRGCATRARSVHRKYSSKKGEKIPIVMKCKMLSLAFDDQPGAATDWSKDKISEITAEEEVTISYNHDFIVSGNKAVYSRFPPINGRNFLRD